MKGNLPITTVSFRRDLSDRLSGTNSKRQPLKQHHPSSLMVTCSFMLGVSLSQSSVINGFNASFADGFLILTVFGLAFARALRLPRDWIMFFVALGVVSVLTAVVLILSISGMAPPLISIFGGQLRLAVNFAFLVVGFSAWHAGLAEVVLRGFLSGIILSSLVGALSLFVGVIGGTEGLYFGGVRFRGFMNDPNYYAILAGVGLCILVGLRIWHPLIRSGAIGILIAGVYSSGSKTGVIVLITVALWWITLGIWEQFQAASTSGDRGSITVSILGLSVLCFLLLQSPFFETLLLHTQEADATQRIGVLFQDPLAAITSDGSGRSSAWASAVSLLGLSPIFGTGVGVYQYVALTEFDTETLAHNTYLQVFVEWGVIFASVFFFKIGRLLFGGVRRVRATGDPLVVAILGGLISFLVAFLSLSLNNARLFWILLGMIVAVTAARSDEKQSLINSPGAKAQAHREILPPREGFDSMPKIAFPGDTVGRVRS